MKISAATENPSSVATSGNSGQLAIQHFVQSVGVIIATVGRKEIAEQTISSLALRKNLPSTVIVVGASQSDLPVFPKELPFPVQLLIAPAKGLPIQRNHGIRQLPPSIEFVSFLDDDMEVHDDYFAEVLERCYGGGVP